MWVGVAPRESGAFWGRQGAVPSRKLLRLPRPDFGHLVPRVGNEEETSLPVYWPSQLASLKKSPVAFVVPRRRPSGGRPTELGQHSPRLAYSDAGYAWGTLQRLKTGEPREGIIVCSQAPHPLEPLRRNGRGRHAADGTRRGG